ncbi:PPOX class probable F420-dependent enzyme [Candidatus Nitrososphaera evergladensis SR1]|uniref:PPOX class probable F420-dependent enzyme n=1 Tax=Candidatus Nitrososphaera evergladensis SR1 TaxID=1459636 RepID=A0A075MQX4_9ARCH|nr:PPOX class F420-dependent oxidoreductase [Candidatus Nitrososphaera evergladensis]AIF83227.1 PPOX class probable F420-dependent enzyme [Candidatus Nitrososphaera evergladensis SR1]
MKDKESDFSVDIVNDLPNSAILEPRQENVGASRSVTYISKEDITKLFVGRNLAFISTLSRDGSPTVTPVWADIEDDIILINSFEGSAKVRNARRDPRVALAIVETYNTYNMASIKGRVIEVTAEGADAHLHKLAKKYLGIGRYYYRTPKNKRVIIKIKPEKMIGISIHPASLFLAYTP